MALIGLVLTVTHQAQAQSDEVLTLVEQMPVAKSCLDAAADEQETCTTQAIVSHIANNTKFPEDAKKAKASGTVYISFVINKSGEVEQPKVLRSVHPSLDAEALRVVQTLPAFQPGMQDGKTVNVAYTLPVRYMAN